MALVQGEALAQTAFSVLIEAKKVSAPGEIPVPQTGSSPTVGYRNEWPRLPSGPGSGS